MHYPDAQLEYTGEDGRTGRVNVEVASGHCSASAIRAKANVGFVVHATGSSQARVLRVLGTGGEHGSIRGPTQGDPADFELYGTAMQPWKISAGLTAAVAGVTVLAAGSRLDYLAPFWRVILADHGLVIALHLGLVLAAVAATLYACARAAGLADLGRRVVLVERSIRRGEGDPELAGALRRGAEGDWE